MHHFETAKIIAQNSSKCENRWRGIFGPRAVVYRPLVLKYNVLQFRDPVASRRHPYSLQKIATAIE